MDVRGRREGHSLTENKTPQFISELLHLFGIIRSAEPLCKFKEGLFFLLSSFKFQFNQLH